MTSPIYGLYAIVDTLNSLVFEASELARLYLQGGARVIQLRQKAASREEKETIAKDILAFKKDFNFTFIINDDVELAHTLGADGVHLGQKDVSVAEARKVLGNDKIIGKSTHTWEEAKEAMREAVDYIACGAIFPTNTKPADHPLIDLALVEKIAMTSPVPVVAIGGITRSNVIKVIQTGVHGVAVISALTMAEKPEEAARHFAAFFNDILS